MQRFIPFEDEWDLLDSLRPGDLIPYRIGVLDVPNPAAHRTVPMSPSIFSSAPVLVPMHRAVPADSSST